ncbi:hypothetical protein KCP74_10040 [Salmonella enterica subsp. enterica]|nr:hypothetical protein KCP74_10040 [Salmonella enterica subsp. enterica]
MFANVYLITHAIWQRKRGSRRQRVPPSRTSICMWDGRNSGCPCRMAALSYLIRPTKNSTLRVPVALRYQAIGAQRDITLPAVGRDISQGCWHRRERAETSRLLNRYS